MRTARSSIRSIILLALTTTLTGCATLRPATLPQSVPDNAPDLTRWERVLVLTPGSRIRVDLNTAEEMDARYRDADTETLTVINGTTSTILPRTHVHRVLLVSTRSAEFSLWGLGVGSLAGALLGIEYGLLMAILAPWYGGLGASVGGLLGLIPMESIVYEAP